nr:E3 ubiquitin-protein ligase RNF126-A [Ipomoea batatas]
MPVVVSDSSRVAAEHNHSRYRSQPIAEADPNPHLISSSRSKSTISALLLAPFSPTSPTHDPPITLTPKKKNFTTFRGLGCTASSQVSVPAVIRSSADWDSSRRVKKKKKLRSKKKALDVGGNNVNNPPADVWCGPGIGFATDAASVSRRTASRRGKVDGDTVRPRERSACTLRRMVIPEDNPFLDSDTASGMTRSRMDVLGSRHHRYSRYGFPEGLAEVVMLQSRLMEGGSEGPDRYRDWRLDVDHMSYEELLELGDRIGYVSTGLREDEIDRYVRKTKLPLSAKLSSHFLAETERKCSVCQEEYESDDEMGKLVCGHFYHIHCIKQWLLHKNACPICKSTASRV